MREEQRSASLAAAKDKQKKEEQTKKRRKSSNSSSLQYQKPSLKKSNKILGTSENVNRAATPFIASSSSSSTNERRTQPNTRQTPVDSSKALFDNDTDRSDEIESSSSENDDNVLNTHAVLHRQDINPPTPKKRKPFTKEETRAIREGVKELGIGKGHKSRH